MYYLLTTIIWLICFNNDLPCNSNVTALLLETAAVESDFGNNMKQFHGGPARGWFQMEPDTAHDIIINYIKYRPHLGKWAAMAEGKDLSKLLLRDDFSIAMARIHYMRVKEPVPDTRIARARYWKKYYNTYRGKGTVAKYMEKANKYIGVE